MNFIGQIIFGSVFFLFCFSCTKAGSVPDADYSQVSSEEVFGKSKVLGFTVEMLTGKDAKITAQTLGSEVEEIKKNGAMRLGLNLFGKGVAAGAKAEASIDYVENTLFHKRLAQEDFDIKEGVSNSYEDQDNSLLKKEVIVWCVHSRTVKRSKLRDFKLEFRGSGVGGESKTEWALTSGFRIIVSVNTLLTKKHIRDRKERSVRNWCHNLKTNYKWVEEFFGKELSAQMRNAGWGLSIFKPVMNDKLYASIAEKRESTYMPYGVHEVMHLTKKKSVRAIDCCLCMAKLYKKKWHLGIDNLSPDFEYEVAVSSLLDPEPEKLCMDFNNRTTQLEEDRYSVLNQCHRIQFVTEGGKCESFKNPDDQLKRGSWVPGNKFTEKISVVHVWGPEGKYVGNLSTEDPFKKSEYGVMPYARNGSANWEGHFFRRNKWSFPLKDD